MANDYIDQWDINTVVYDIHDKGRGQPNGVATLDSEGRIPYEQLPEDSLTFKGYWDADTNSPTLADGTGTSGEFYFVSVAGTQNLGSGSQYFAVGDRVLYDGSIWKNISGGSVKTINGQGPDAQGNISGVVTSVNSTTPDASGNVTLTAMLSVNNTNPDALGNINLFGATETETQRFYFTNGQDRGGFSEVWDALIAFITKGLYFTFSASAYISDGTTISSRTYIGLYRYHNINEITCDILNSNVLTKSGAVQGWLDASGLTFRRLPVNVSGNGYTCIHHQYFTWSNAVAQLSFGLAFNQTGTTSIEITIHKLKAQNS